MRKTNLPQSPKAARPSLARNPTNPLEPIMTKQPYETPIVEQNAQLKAITEADLPISGVIFNDN